MQKKPLLSICIPTYNRKKYLKRLLDSIVCQKEFTDTDDVEVIVDDGPSTDDTETMVKEYIKKYGGKIRYYRNPVRIGMCPAFLEALDLGTGKYLWLMGSDDSFSNNALEIVLKTINSYGSRLILCNRDGIEKIESKNGELDYKVVNFNGFSDFSTYLGYQDNNTYHKDTYFTFISCHIFNREYFYESYNFIINDLKISDDMIQHHYFNFSFIGFTGIKVGDIITIIDTPHLVFYGSDNETSRNLNKKIVKDLDQMMKFLMDTYPISKNGKKTMKKIVFWWRMSLFILPICRRICKLPGLAQIYSFFSKRHIKNMGIE